MKSRFVFTVLVLTGLLTTSGPALRAQGQTRHQQAATWLDPVIESIEVLDVSAAVRTAVLTRIGVRVGDPLTVEAKHRIGLEIGRIQKGMTFSYVPGLKKGSVKLRIDPSC